MAEKVFYPDRIIYIDNVPHPIEGNVRPTRMGFECPFKPGDDPQDFFEWAEKEIGKWADERAKRIIANQEIPEWRKNEANLHRHPSVIAVQKDDEDKIIADILTSSDLVELGKFKFLTISNDLFRKAYCKRLKELEPK